MAQITWNVDEPTYKKIAHSAEIRKYTVPQFVAGHMSYVVNNDWPDDFFDLAGAIDDESFVVDD